MQLSLIRKDESEYHNSSMRILSVFQPLSRLLRKSDQRSLISLPVQYTHLLLTSKPKITSHPLIVLNNTIHLLSTSKILCRMSLPVALQIIFPKHLNRRSDLTPKSVSRRHYASRHGCCQSRYSSATARAVETTA